MTTPLTESAFDTVFLSPTATDRSPAADPEGGPSTHPPSKLNITARALEAGCDAMTHAGNSRTGSSDSTIPKLSAAAVEGEESLAVALASAGNALRADQMDLQAPGTAPELLENTLVAASVLPKDSNAHCALGSGDAGVCLHGACMGHVHRRV